MTSKNILWLGSLLFALLCTSCIAWFLDKHNPQIQQVNYQNTTRDTIALEKDPFAQDVEIDEFIGEHIKKEAAQLDHPLLSDIQTKENNHSISKPKIKKPILIANKIDHTIIPIKKPVIKQKKSEKLIKKQTHHVYKSHKAIEIEPLLYTMELSSDANHLNNKDKMMLNILIKKAKQHPFSRIKIDLAKLSTKSRKYLKAIKRYFYKNGIDTQRIYVKVEKSTFPVQIVKKQKNTSIEILLIERL